jgi:hypothetical protein
MNKNQDKEFLKDPANLPQIRFPDERSMSLPDPAGDLDDIEKLSKIVEGSFKAIASATGLSEKEVLHAIENTHVDMLKDVLKDVINVDVLKEGIREAIKNIALATDLDTEQITDIFSAKKGTNLKDIVSRLYDSMRASRATQP